ncbi:MAG: SPOR domain-containing protein [Sphingomonadales bacterium]
MTDIRADDELPGEEEDRLPWLEAVDEDEERDGPSPMKLAVAVLVGLVAIGLVVSGLFWLGNRGASEGPPETIAAQPGPYKVRPDHPGGMQVQESGESALAASGGAEPKGTINVDAVPEAPLAKAPPAAAPAPALQAGAKAPPAAQAPAAAPAGPGGSVQLGAFSSQAAADNAWKALSARFKYLEPLTHSVVPVSAGGRTLYRLRASGPNAANLCGRLRVAGETCVSVS